MGTVLKPSFSNSLIIVLRAPLKKSTVTFQTVLIKYTIIVSRDLSKSLFKNFINIVVKKARVLKGPLENHSYGDEILLKDVVFLSQRDY